MSLCYGLAGTAVEGLIANDESTVGVRLGDGRRRIRSLASVAQQTERRYGVIDSWCAQTSGVQVAGDKGRQAGPTLAEFVKITMHFGGPSPAILVSRALSRSFSPGF